MGSASSPQDRGASARVLSPGPCPVGVEPELCSVGSSGSGARHAYRFRCGSGCARLRSTGRGPRTSGAPSGGPQRRGTDRNVVAAPALGLDADALDLFASFSALRMARTRAHSA